MWYRVCLLPILVRESFSRYVGCISFLCFDLELFRSIPPLFLLVFSGDLFEGVFTHNPSDRRFVTGFSEGQVVADETAPGPPTR